MITPRIFESYFGEHVSGYEVFSRANYLSVKMDNPGITRVQFMQILEIMWMHKRANGIR